MIQLQTKINIKDNTGIKLGKCIKILKGKGIIGDIILISIEKIQSKKSNKKQKFKKGSIVKALIIESKFYKKNSIGHYFSFNENNAIILNDNDQPIGTRIMVPIFFEFKIQKKFKNISLVSHIL